MAIADVMARQATGEVDLLGVVVTAGNLDLTHEVRNATAWLRLCISAFGGADYVPVFAGATQAIKRPHQFTPETHGPTGSGDADLAQWSGLASNVPGVQAWITLTRRYRGAVHAIVTGPCSTLALAIEADPQLPERLASLTIMGGAFLATQATRPQSRNGTATATPRPPKGSARPSPGGASGPAGLGRM